MMLQINRSLIFTLTERAGSIAYLRNRLLGLQELGGKQVMHRCRMVSLHMFLIGSKIEMFMLRVFRTPPYSLLMRPLLMACPVFPAVI